MIANRPLGLWLIGSVVLSSASLSFSQERLQAAPKQPSIGAGAGAQAPASPGSRAPGEDAIAVPRTGAGVDTARAPSDEEKDIWKPWTPTQFYQALKNPEGYKGGRGLISAQGMSGMFLNPTSGTLEQGQLTVQYCILLFQQPFPVRVGHGIMAAYGVDDFFEIGGFVNIADRRKDLETLMVAGPFARFRLFKDEEWWPELSIGGIYLDGDSDDDAIARSEVDLMASKYFQITEKGFVRSFRLHLGGRQIFRPENPAGVDRTATLGFLGGDLEIPWGLHAVSEVGTEEGITGGAVDKTPWSVGGQWRPNNVVGVSVAAVQNGGMHRVSLYIGIGFMLEF